MILTEEEAKTKRCQESFGSQPNAPFGSMHMAVTASYAQPMSPTHCLGSACMAWRWKIEGGQMTVAPLYAGFNQGPSHAIPVPGTSKPSTTHGYCGKAGLP
jgi:hypothetical protein